MEGGQAVWELVFEEARRDRQDGYIDPEENNRSKKVSFPIVTPSDSERETRREADKMSRVSDLGVIARD